MPPNRSLRRFCKVRWLAWLAVAAVVSLLSCRKDVAEAGGPGARPVPVSVATVIRKDMPLDVSAVGSVEAFSMVSMQAEVGGALQKVHFQEGDYVEKGQILFTLDRRPFEATLREAAAQRDRNAALYANAKRDLERYQTLVAQNFVSREDYERIRTNAEALEASLRADRSAVEAAALNVQHATLRAPIAGRTGTLLVHAGNIVKPNGDPLVVIRQIKPVNIRFSLPEAFVSRVRERMHAGSLAVQAQARDHTSPPAHGELTFIENTVDTATGTIEFKARFANDDERFWPGQYVDVALRLTVDAGVVVIPASAVQRSREGQVVFVVGKDAKVSPRTVDIARTVEEQTVVLKGLAEGDVVVTDGQMQLTEGSVVTVKPASPAASTPAASGSAP